MTEDRNFKWSSEPLCICLCLGLNPCQCFRLRTNVRKFTPKSSNLRTYYLPVGQTDAEVFVERNIDILSIYEAILYLFQ